MKFAIPSYKREKVILEKTLSLLEVYNVSKKDIFIFVANKEEEKIYSNHLGKGYNLIVGVIKLFKQRNFICNYFKDGEEIVYFDDDVSRITELGNKKLNDLPNLKEFCKEAFKECRSKSLYLWGIYPVDNHYFMRNTITHDLRFIVGPFYGVINRKSNDLKLWIDEKEDSLRTLQFYTKDGGVVRYNFVGVKTKFYSDGGMSVGRNRIDASFQATKEINKKYPNLTTIVKPTKTNPYYELRLKDKSSS